MSGARVSIGDETPTGEPLNGPKGPFTTADDDDVTEETDADDSRRKEQSRHAPPAKP